MIRPEIVRAAALAMLLTLLPSFVVSQTQPAAPASSELSGMFTFLKEGEFVQLTVEGGELSGFVSRFGDTADDKGQFIDQFFDKTSLQSEHLTFKTKTVHGVWYEFDGTLTTTPGKQKGEEGYRVLKGKLTMHNLDAKDVDHPSERTVEFKSFPDLRRQ